MWKLSQEETFANEMKAKEAEYLHRLEKEWKKREEERQKVFTQKVHVIALLDTRVYIYVHQQVPELVASVFLSVRLSVHLLPLNI